MVGDIEYNGIESLNFNLVCKSVKRPLIPSIRTTTISIYGKSGIIDYDNNDYNTKQIIMRIAYVGKSYIELRERARDIAAWLSIGKWSKLIINDEPDKYYLAKVVSEIDLNTLKRLGEADIIFECQPFSYYLYDTAFDPTWDDMDITWETADMPWSMVESYQFRNSGSFTFDNIGTKTIDYKSPQGSKSLIKINGTWNTINIRLNGKIISYIKAGTGELIIDNVEMEVYLNGANKLINIDGDIDSFLPIIPGENTIEITGVGLNIAITIDFIPMWI